MAHLATAHSGCLFHCDTLDTVWSTSTIVVPTVVLYLRLKWPGHEVHYLPYSDEVKNEWR